MERDIKRMQTLWSVVTAISTAVVVTVDGWRLTSLAWLLLLLSLRQWGAPALVRYAMANRASSILAIAVVMLPLGALIGVLATIPDRMVEYYYPGAVTVTITGGNVPYASYLTGIIGLLALPPAVVYIVAVRFIILDMIKWLITGRGVSGRRGPLVFLLDNERDRHCLFAVDSFGAIHFRPTLRDLLELLADASVTSGDALPALICIAHDEGKALAVYGSGMACLTQRNGRPVGKDNFQFGDLQQLVTHFAYGEFSEIERQLAQDRR